MKGNGYSNTYLRFFRISGIIDTEYFYQPFKDEAQTALFKDPVRTAQ
jgi:hypothetical protein